MTSTMQAAVYTRYGAPEVLQVKSLSKPNPKDNEILVKIHASAVTSGDCRLRRADPFAVRLLFGLFKPKKNVLGGVFSGVVAAVGKNVRKFKVGDEVFGSSYPNFGAYAEFVSLPASAPLAIKPQNISLEEAAAIPFGGMTAFHFLQKANIQAGQKVLIYGASGAVGSAAVQIAKYYGAHVTGVCSTANVELVKSLGADAVIDYTQADFAEKAGQFDVVYETVNKAPVSSCVKALKPGGLLILGASMVSEMLQGAWVSMTGNIKVLSGVIVETSEALDFLKKLLENGQFRAVIDQQFTLGDIAKAHDYVDKGHKKGNVIVRVI